MGKLNTVSMPCSAWAIRRNTIEQELLWEDVGPRRRESPQQSTNTTRISKYHMGLVLVVMVMMMMVRMLSLLLLLTYEAKLRAADVVVG